MKRILKSALFILTLVGVTGLFGVFTSSMTPSEKARSERSQHDIQHIKNGSYLLVNFKRPSVWQDKVLIIKDWSGNLYVHLLPAENDMISLPDLYWGWAVYGCKNFGPETDNNNNIVKNGTIKCHDKDISIFWNENLWLWSYSGKAKHEWLPNMHSPKYEIKENILYING